MHKTSKLLLAITAAALWANAMIMILSPTTANAQNSQLTNIEGYLSRIAKDISDTRSAVSNIESHVSTIHNGISLDKSFCR